MMPTLEHSDYRFSVTSRTDDLAVVGCLRALADFSQKSGNKRIAWGGTTDAYWRRNGHSVTTGGRCPARAMTIQHRLRPVEAG
jgi:hypothetical protein